jgi:hypothetical protein
MVHTIYVKGFYFGGPYPNQDFGVGIVSYKLF